MASEVWINDWDNEYSAVYKALIHWRRNVPYGEPFSDWMEKHHRCYVTVSSNTFTPNVRFFSPADKTLFLLKWS